MSIRPPPIVFDNGTEVCRVGYGGNEVPSVQFPSMVGRPFLYSAIPSLKMTSFVGNNAVNKTNTLTLTYPVEHGTISDWDDMERIWQHSFYELSCTPKEHSVMLTEPPLSPRMNREKMGQILFETFSVPRLFIIDQAVCAWNVAGKIDGLYVDSGAGVTHVTPIANGYIVKNAVFRMNLGGSNLTEYLCKLLTTRGHYYDSSSNRELVNDIKKNLCYVSLDYDHELAVIESSDGLEKKYKNVFLKEERFICPEAIFQPMLLSRNHDGIHEVIAKSIKLCPETMQPSMYENIVLSGGNTFIPNFVPRLQREVKALAPSDQNVETNALSTRDTHVWKGASSLAAEPTFEESWISRADYNESGSSILFRK